MLQSASCRSLKALYASNAFSLAELLMVLLIVAQIATFTIPKVIMAQQRSHSNAAAKEVAGMIAGAHQRAMLAGTLNASTKPADLTPYMNYVSVYTSGTRVDTVPTGAPITVNACSATAPCLVLHHGGILQPQPEYFNGTTPLNVIQFRYDPDGVYSGLNTDVPGVSIQFELYFNGFLTTRGQAKAGSCHNDVCPFGAGPFDPSWFSW